MLILPGNQRRVVGPHIQLSELQKSLQCTSESLSPLEGQGARQKPEEHETLDRNMLDPVRNIRRSLNRISEAGTPNRLEFLKSILVKKWISKGCCGNRGLGA
jgi:phosphomevalonate kinase